MIRDLRNLLLYAKHKGVFNTFNIDEVQYSQKIYTNTHLLEHCLPESNKANICLMNNYTFHNDHNDQYNDND